MDLEVHLESQAALGISTRPPNLSVRVEHTGGIYRPGIGESEVCGFTESVSP